MNRNTQESYDFYEELPAAEESQDDTALEDVDASWDEGEDTEEKSEEEADDTKSESEEDTAEDAESEEESTEEEATEEEPQTDEEKQKQHNKEMAAQRIHAKEEAKAQRDATIRAEQAAYVAEADAEDPKDFAFRQLQVDAYNNNVNANTNRLSGEYQRAVKDFDTLSDPNPVIQARINRAIDLFQSSNVSIDKYGNPTEIRGDFYSYLQTEADSIRELTGIGARKQATSKTKEKSKVSLVPSRAPKSKSDPEMEGFDEEAARW